jgi:hypothetical protein
VVVAQVRLEEIQPARLLPGLAAQEQHQALLVLALLMLEAAEAVFTAGALAVLVVLVVVVQVLDLERELLDPQTRVVVAAAEQLETQAVQVVPGL